MKIDAVFPDKIAVFCRFCYPFMTSYLSIVYLFGNVRLKSRFLLLYQYNPFLAWSRIGFMVRRFRRWGPYPRLQRWIRVESRLFATGH